LSRIYTLGFISNEPFLLLCVNRKDLCENIAKKSWRREEEENTRNIKERYVKRETNNFYVSALQPF